MQKQDFEKNIFSRGIEPSMTTNPNILIVAFWTILDIPFWFSFAHRLTQSPFMRAGGLKPLYNHTVCDTPPQIHEVKNLLIIAPHRPDACASIHSSSLH